MDPLKIILRQTAGALNSFQQQMNKKQPGVAVLIEEVPPAEAGCQQRKQYDFELIFDTYMLMAHCCYRLNNPVLYSEYFEKAKKFKDFRKLEESVKKVDMQKLKEEF
jgi:hypothetical protein